MNRPNCIYACRVLTLLFDTKSGWGQLYAVFYYRWIETYLGWGFLLLIAVDRDGLNRGRAALSFGLTGPVTALLTLRQGVICAGRAAIIHPHRPVNPYKHPCWRKRKEELPSDNSPERDSVLLLRGGCHFSWPATFDMCPPSDCDWAEVGRCLKWVSVRDVQGWNTFSWPLKKKEREWCVHVFEALSNRHISAGAQHLVFGVLIFTSLFLKLGLKLVRGD